MQLKKNPQLDALIKQAYRQQPSFLRQTLNSIKFTNKRHLQKKTFPDQKRKSVGRTLLKIIFIYFPLVVILPAAVITLAAIASSYVFGSCGGGNTARSEKPLYTMLTQ